MVPYNGKIRFLRYNFFSEKIEIYFLNIFRKISFGFDALSEFEVKIGLKHDFKLFFLKNEKIVFFENSEKFCENPLKI